MGDSWKSATVWGRRANLDMLMIMRMTMVSVPFVAPLGG